MWCLLGYYKSGHLAQLLFKQKKNSTPNYLYHTDSVATSVSFLPIYICLSKRPGLMSAGSKISGLFVPARTTTLVAVLNPTRKEPETLNRITLKINRDQSSRMWGEVYSPSISTSNWLRVFSCSLCPPKFPRPLFLPTASISSMNRMHGAFLRASTKRSRTYENGIQN